MKKIYFWSILTLIVMALPQYVEAQVNTQRERVTHVTPAEALDVGYAFLQTSSGTRSGEVNKQNMHLVYTGKAIDSLTLATTDCYYVFALQPKGFVIVAADNRVEPILGYSYDNAFVPENMPVHVRKWLGNYEQQIKAVIEQDIASASETDIKWTRLKAGQSLSTRSGESVEPLLTTTWDQGQYYNSLCPADANGVDGHALTGCVATAMAQIINYWGYPTHGRGTHGYNSFYGNLTVNYDSANYDFANMPDALSSTSTATEVSAVAQLMYHCGVAVNMDYAPDESSAFNVEARAALINFFRFSPNISHIEKSHFSNMSWNNLLRENINAGQPVMYGGSSDNGGHSFVCDGYNDDNYFHFNFGWSGHADGWYLTTSVNPGNYEYNTSQTALVGIVPDSTTNIILGQVNGTSTFTVDEPMEFYHLMGHNAYSGLDYSNSCHNTVFFVSADTTKHLVLDILSFENQNVTVYDSLLGNQLTILSSNSNHNPVVSTVSSLTLVYQGFIRHAGFHLSVSQNNGCRMVSNVSSSVDTNTIHLSWHENGNASQWQVEYGMKGFSHGDGTIVTANDTTIDINGLIKFREYDMYVRPICDGNQKGPWCQAVTVMPLARYWTDVVTSQPEGYVVDSLGNVTISSAEGLAWFSYVCRSDDFIGRCVSLSADINLGEYIWSPTGIGFGLGHSFSGTFDGQGHIIDSMYSIGTWVTGLLGFIDGATILNVMLTNIYSKNTSSYSYFEDIIVAGLVGRCSESPNTIMNCFVSGKIEGIDGGAVAPIIARGASTVINCASNCEIVQKRNIYVGGIAGDFCGDGGVIRNCYSASSLYRCSSAFKRHVLSYGAGTVVENCYGFMSRNGNMPIAGGTNVILHDNTLFNETNSGFYLLQPVYFESDDQYYSNLTEVLNAGVRKYNLEGLRLWVDDTAGINEGLPILGPEYVVTCPNIQNLSAKNIVGSNGEYGVELSWNEMGNATTWEIEYHMADSLNVVRKTVFSNPDTLWELTLQNTYVFRLRPICSTTNRGGWSEGLNHVFERPYWTEIVTSQPDGYVIDDSGNVTISSPEGLAWLISTVNGLNGQQANDFDGKNVTLTQDINIGQYRWKAINPHCSDSQS